jgi:hypothetical protein
MLPAVALKVVEDEPAGTVTDTGVVSSTPLLARETAVPPAGEAPLKVTVHVLAAPDANVVGLHCTDANAGEATTVSVAACVVPE